ncbi:MAG: YihY/virulence factor BrkB family protein [Clostridiales bacterium]|nr:YihY/virulence factor BrkB family protein [Clostridiales bacterium]
MRKTLLKGKFAYIVRRLVKRYFRDNVSKTGAELAYFFLFSFFPFLIFINLLVGTFHIPIDIITGILKVVPPDVEKIVADYFSYIGSFESKTLLVTGLVLTLYFLSRAINSLIQAVNAAYRTKKKRPGFSNILVSIAFTAVIMISIGIMFVIMISGKNVLFAIVDFIKLPILSHDFIYIWDALRFLIAGVYSFLFLVCLYYVVPNKRLTFRSSIPGSIFAMLSWLLISSGFSYYVQNMGRYSVLYGSIGAIMVLMLWLYLTGIVLVMGAELNDILITLNESCQCELENEQ